MIWSWVKSLVTGSPAGPGSASAAPSTGHATATARSRRDPEWANLPPVQRALDRPLSPVAPLDIFTESLTAHQNPSFLAPLRHVVDPTGSGGLVTGLATTIPSAPRHYAGTAHLSVPATHTLTLPVQRQRMNWTPDVGLADPSGGSPGDVDDMDSMSPDTLSPEATASSIPIQRSLSAVDSLPARRPTFPSIAERELPVVKQFTSPERSESATVAHLPDGDRVHAAAEETPSDSTAELTAPLGGFSAAINALQGESPAETGRSAATPTRPSAPDRHPVLEVQRLRAGPSTHDPVRLDAASHDTVDSSSSPRSPTPIHTPLPPVAVPVELPVDGGTTSRESSLPQSIEAPSPTSPGHSLRSAAEGPVQRSPSAPLQRLPVLPVVNSETKRPSSPRRERQPDSDADTVRQNAAPLVSTPAEAGHSPEAASSLLQVQRSVGPGVGEEADVLPAHAGPAVHALPVVTRFGMADEPSEPTRTVGLLPEQSPLLSRSTQLQRVPEMPAAPAVESLPIQRVSHAPHLHNANIPPDPISPTDSAATAGTALPALSGTPTAYEPPQPMHTVGLLAERPPLLPASDLVRNGAVPAPIQRVTYSSTSASPGRSDPTTPHPMGSPWSISPTREEIRSVIPSVDEQPVPVQRAVPTVSQDVNPSRSTTTTNGLPRLAPPRISPPPVHAVGPAVSFSSMFSTTAADDHPAGADGFTSVQLQPARVEPDVSLQRQESSPVAEAPPEVSSPTPASAIGTAPGISSDPKSDLDEMARKLFEPLSARLRAELWLDRERAGLIADVRR